MVTMETFRYERASQSSCATMIMSSSMLMSWAWYLPLKMSLMILILVLMMLEEDVHDYKCDSSDHNDKDDLQT